MASRTISLTEREFKAIVRAAALYESEYSGDSDWAPEGWAQDCRALDRVIDKWHTESKH